MGRTVYFHVYVAKDATPTVADEINGPAIAVDEDELMQHEDEIKQQAIDDFIKWLKGNPERLREHAQPKGGLGAWGMGETRVEQYKLEAKERIKSGRPVAVVGESKGKKVTMGRWKGKIAYWVRDVKSGRILTWGTK